MLILTADLIPVLHYEGGIYQRPLERVPSTEERTEYAKCAAGRAVEQYPTIAKLYLQDATTHDFMVEGWIDTETWAVTWLPTPDPLDHFPPPLPRPTRPRHPERP